MVTILWVVVTPFAVLLPYREFNLLGRGNSCGVTITTYFNSAVHITTFTLLPFWFFPTSDNCSNWLTPIPNWGMDLDDVKVGASFERASNVVSSLTLIVGMSSSWVHSNILRELNLENENTLIYTSTYKLMETKWGQDCSAVAFTTCSCIFVIDCRYY